MIKTLLSQLVIPVSTRPGLPHPVALGTGGRWLIVVAWLIGLAGSDLPNVRAEAPATLPGTRPFTGDESTLAAENVAGVHRFLEARTEELRGRRHEHWQRDFSSPGAYVDSVAGNRESFRRIIGVDREGREDCDELTFEETSRFSSEIARTPQYTVSLVRWKVRSGIEAEGLLLQPHAPPKARIVALPDADQTPEMAAGLVPGRPADDRFAHRLAVCGCQVLIPALISRQDEFSGNERVDRYTNQPHREWIYRQAFQLGHHVIGIEVEQVQAAIEWFAHQNEAEPLPIGLVGYGEGGLLAFYTAALEPVSVQATLVSGYFGPREGLSQEPIYRNVWRLLAEFGDAEIASLVAPRGLIIDPSLAPEVSGPPPARGGRSGAAPGAIPRPSLASVRGEYERARELVGPDFAEHFQLVERGVDEPPSAISLAAMEALLRSLDLPADDIARLSTDVAPATWPPTRPHDLAARQSRLVRQVERYLQRRMEEAVFARADFFWEPAWDGARQAASRSATGAAAGIGPEAWSDSVVSLRQTFRDDFIGRLPDPSLPPNPRSKKLQETANWTAYLVVLDVWPEVISWGYLLLPNDLQPNEIRPAVVCQHGIGGTPAATIDPANPAYRGFAAALADRGFIVYAPYNPNAAPGDTEFRQLQRRAHPLGCSIFSVITGQHQRILAWLGGLDSVDANRIGFYGLSYGGKTAMRVPAALEGYALSICSGDYNQWVRKIITPLAVTNAAPGSQRFSSYMFTREYEIHEFDQGHTFDYAEMAALIAPRPFMVERGHRDLVGSDEWVAFEYAPVRRLYADLGIPERTTIEFFADGHVIHGQGTFDFLHRFLDWP